MLLSPGNREVILNLKINGEEIKQVETFRYLDVDLDPKLSFKNQVERITSKYRQAIGALNRSIRKFAPKKVFEHLHKTTVEPILTYAIEAWYPSQGTLQTSAERVKKGVPTRED